MLQRRCNLFELQIIVDKANMAAACLRWTCKTKRPREPADEKAAARARPRPRGNNVKCLSCSPVFPSICVDHNLIWQFKC